MKTTIVALTGVVLALAEQTSSSKNIRDIVSMINTGEASILEVYGIPIEAETPFRIDKDKLRRSYTYRIEVRDLSGASCGAPFSQALASAHFELREARKSDLRVAIIVSTRKEQIASMYLDKYGLLVFGDYEADGSLMIDWLRTTLGACTK